MCRIAVFGGSFNPIHSGHLVIAQYAVQEFSLDKLIFVPARIPPHKKLDGKVADAERLRMVEAAIRGNPAFVVSDFELNRNKVSYSIDTIRELKKQEDGDFYFLIGEDLVAGLNGWKEIDALCQLVRFAVAVRGDQVSGKGPVPVERFVTPRIDISSTEIRERIKLGQSVRYLVPESVYQILTENGFYKE